MATIYRFIVEQKTSRRSGRKNDDSGADPKTPSKKKGKLHTLLSGPKGGVEHNRKMRAINPLLNRLTGGYWEKGMRLGRAGLGLLKFNEAGEIAGFSGPAIAIIIALVIQTVLKAISMSRQYGTERNVQNYKSMETGLAAIRGDFEISANLISGRLTFNQNK